MKFTHCLQTLILAAAVFVPPVIAQLPTTGQATALLSTRPDLVKQLQSQIAASGLTPDQVRARLKASGYPESLLDAYLPGSTAVASPDTSVLAAVKALGLPQIAPTVAPTVAAAEAAADAATAAASAAAAATSGAAARSNIFGLDVFRRTTSQFDPTQAGAVDASYRVGPGDLLVLILTGGVEAAYSLDVTREGFVVVPQVGQVYVANLTLEQVRSLFFTRLSRVYSGIGRGSDAATRFTVTIGRVRTNQIFVIGETSSPGSYQVSALGTLLTALYAAGGPSVNGSLREIAVRRSGQVVGGFDVYDYLINGNTANDIRLENADVIFVPFRGARVSIVGEIGRPALYELRQGETLQDLVRMAGGFTAAAARQRIQVRRILPPEQRASGGRDRVVIDIAADQLVNGVAPAYRLEAGDEVEVFAVSERLRDRISVNGAVWMPGPQGLRSGMLLSDAIKAAGGVKPDVYLDLVLVTRTSPDGRTTQLRTNFRDTTGAPAEDLSLHEDDAVRVFARSEFRDLRNLSLEGPVKRGGSFEYREGITLRDLILLAEGFTDSTNVRDEVLLSRLQPDMTRRQERHRLRNAGGDVDALVLEPGDEIKLTTYSQYRPARSIAVAGAVKSPGEIPFREGMTLRDAVQLAGGLNESAFLGSAEVARLPEDRKPGQLATTIRVPLDSTYLFERGPDGKYLGPPGLPAPTAKAPDVPLEPYDNILILRQPDWHLQGTVRIEGEVQFPGEYTLMSRDERISDLVKRAGGLTPRAYPEGGVFVRTHQNIGRVDVHLPTVLRRMNSRDNFVLFSGDELRIPQLVPIVKVTGAVSAPASVAWVKGAKMDYYLRAAGGVLPTGDRKRAFVTQPNGGRDPYRARLLIPDHVPIPLAGADITVPVKPESKTDKAAMAGAIAQVVAGAVTILIVALRK